MPWTLVLAPVAALISIVTAPDNDSALLLSPSEPVPLTPGASVPPLFTVTGPVTPVPERVPPLFTVTALLAIDPSTFNVPPLMVVTPLYVLVPVRVSSSARYRYCAGAADHDAAGLGDGVGERQRGIIDDIASHRSVFG